MIVIIDYTVGNIKSMCNSFHHIDCDIKLSCKRKDIETTTGIVLPGVATFSYAVKTLGSAAQLIKEAALAHNHRSSIKYTNLEV